jgi:hypothetical protein
MTRFGWLVVSGTIIAVIGIALLLWGFARQSSTPLLNEDDGPVEVVDPSALSIYTSGEFGLSLMYPSTAMVEDSLSGVSFKWRANSSAEGTPVVRIKTQGGEVRVGISDDSEATASCVEEGPSETMIGSTMLGETVWQTFTFDELGTEDERHVTSYRLMHDGSCFVVEAFEPVGGSPPSPAENVDLVVRSFTLAR